MPDNGNEYQPDVLVLTLDRRTMELTMSGNAQEYLATNPRGFDLVWAMLQQALHHIDVQFRIAANLEVQVRQKQEQARAQQEFDRVQGILRRQ